jgi:hypothetical protein
MLTFLNRKKKVTLDCFTTNQVAYEFFPIVEAIKTVPDWWKKLPKSVTPEPDIKYYKTMKQCYGFVEFYKRGFVIENWTDNNFYVTKDKYQYIFSNEGNSVEHPKHQYAGGFENFHHAKLISPWCIREKNGYHFMFMGAEWSLEYFDIKILPGIVEYSVNHDTHINIMLPKKEQPYPFHIKSGNPIVHIIPLNDDIDFNIKSHLINQKEFDNMFYIPSSVFGRIPKLKKILKRNKDRNKAKCPFRS